MNNSTAELSIPAQVRFNEAGLVPAIVQEHSSKTVLMLAWMNRQALQQTLQTGRVTYWSRSRGQLWRKGDTSGHRQYLQRISYDCDGDTLLLQVTQVGAACHTGSHSCFAAGDIEFSAPPPSDDAPRSAAEPSEGVAND